MDDTVTVRDLMTREFVGVTESDSLRGTATLLADEDAACAVVLRGTEPVGLVTATQVLGALADGADLDETTVASVMSDPPDTLSPDQDLDDAVAAVSSADRWHALVSDGDGVVGLVDARDVLAAGASKPPVSDAVTGAQSATLRQYDANDAEASGRGAYSTQGVCEACGSLARELVDVNGQLVCADCRSV